MSAAAGAAGSSVSIRLTVMRSREKRCWVRPAITAMAFASIAFAQAGKGELPERPDRPFHVFILAEPTGDPQAVESIEKAESECRKILKRRKDWFDVGEREGSEIVLEIEAHWVDESMIRERSWSINVVREHHYLQARVILFGAEFGLRADDGRSRGWLGGTVEGASAELVDALQEVLKKNYRQLAAIRK